VYARCVLRGNDEICGVVKFSGAHITMTFSLQSCDYKEYYMLSTNLFVIHVFSFGPRISLGMLLARATRMCRVESFACPSKLCHY
jgi:hypothetical protein